MTYEEGFLILFINEETEPLELCSLSKVMCSLQGSLLDHYAVLPLRAGICLAHGSAYSSACYLVDTQ